MKWKRSQTVEPPPTLNTTEHGSPNPDPGKITSPKRNVQGMNNGQTDQTTSHTPARINTAMKIRDAQLISETDLEKVTNMQGEQTPVKVMKTFETHEDVRGEGEERSKTVKILDIRTLAKEGNREGNLKGEGGGGTSKRRNEISIGGMEYMSPAKKRKQNTILISFKNSGPKKNRNLSPVILRLPKIVTGVKYCHYALVMPQTKDSN